jgi:uncharacterized protein YtpQ (UPF0354 family)
VRYTHQLCVEGVPVPSNNLLSEVLPQFFPAHWLDDAPDLVFSAFPSRIRIGYVVRREGSYSYVMRPTLEDVGVSLQALHNSALDNLRAMPCGGLRVGQTPGGPEAFLTGVDDNFQAIRILLPNVQAAIVQEMGEEFFAAIPCRDWFVCWSRNQSKEWQERNVAKALEDFINDEYNLSPDILLRSMDGFSVHLAQEINA